jgi:hypothetical protein
MISPAKLGQTGTGPAATVRPVGDLKGRTEMSTSTWFRTAIAFAALFGSALTAAAQTPATPADAAPFVGTWVLMLETPQGNMPLDLSVKSDAGKVVGEVGSEMFPATAITDVTKSDASLVLSYAMDFQGNQIPMKITLTPDGDKMKFGFDAAGGQFFIEGAATKK